MINIQGNRNQKEESIRYLKKVQGLQVDHLQNLERILKEEKQQICGIHEIRKGQY